MPWGGTVGQYAPRKKRQENLVSLIGGYKTHRRDSEGGRRIAVDSAVATLATKRLHLGPGGWDLNRYALAAEHLSQNRQPFMSLH